MIGLNFSNPDALWFLLFVPLVVLTHFLGMNYSRSRAIKFSNYEALEKVVGNQPVSANYINLILRVIAVIFLVLSVSGVTIQYDAFVSHSDYVIAVDVSTTMLADDLPPTRL